MSWAVRFNSASQQYAKSNNAPGIANIFTVEIRVNLPSGNTSGYIWSNTSPSGFPTFLYTNGAGGISVCLGDNSSQSTQYNSPAGILPYGSSHVISLVVDVWAQRLTVYIDGVQSYQVSIPTITSILCQDTTVPFKLMMGYFDGGWTPGDVQEVRIWNVALSQATISAWLDRRIDDTHPNKSALKLYWKLNDGSGTALADSSGNGYTGTLYNSPTWVTGYQLDNIHANAAPLALHLTLGTPRLGIAIRAPPLILTRSLVSMNAYQGINVTVAPLTLRRQLEPLQLTFGQLSVTAGSLQLHRTLMPITASLHLAVTASPLTLRKSLTNATATFGPLNVSAGPLTLIRSLGSAKATMIYGEQYSVQLENGGPGLAVNDLIEAVSYDYDAAANMVLKYVVQAVVEDTSIEGQIKIGVTSGAEYLDEFATGIQFVRWGNISNPSRRASITLDSLTDGKGRIVIRDGVSSWEDKDDINKMPVILGPLDGLIDPVYGDLAGKKALLRGDIIIDGRIISRPGSAVSGDHLVDSSVLAKKLKQSSRAFATTVKFSSNGDTRVDWTAGSLTDAAGGNYNILAGYISGLTASTLFIYFSPDDPTHLHWTTDINTASNDERVIVCTAQAAMIAGAGAHFNPVVGVFPAASPQWVDSIYVKTAVVQQLVADEVDAKVANFNFVTANELAATNAVVAQKLTIGGAADDVNNGTTLIHGGKIIATEITALGTVTAGTFNLGNGRFQVDAGGKLTAVEAVFKNAGNSHNLTVDLNGILIDDGMWISLRQIDLGAFGDFTITGFHGDTLFRIDGSDAYVAEYKVWNQRNFATESNLAGVAPTTGAPTQRDTSSGKIWLLIAGVYRQIA